MNKAGISKKRIVGKVPDGAIPLFRLKSSPPQPKPKRIVKKKSRIPAPSVGLFNDYMKSVPPVPTGKKILTLANVKAKANADHSSVEREHLEAIDLDDFDTGEYYRFHDVDFGSDRND